jgi:hypothetical protein
MNNLILSATGNNKSRHKYCFNKNEKFKKEFINLLLKLGFEEKKISTFWTKTVSIKGHEEEGLIVHPKISYFEDSLNIIENRNYELEIFIGKKKIFVVIKLKNKKKRTRENLINQLINSSWITPKEIEIRKKEDKKKLQGYLPKRKKIIKKK